jgi:hypothetical protein
MARTWEDYGNDAIRVLYPTTRDGIDYMWGRPPDDETAPQGLIAVQPWFHPDLALIEYVATDRMNKDPTNTGVEPEPPEPVAPTITTVTPTTAVLPDPFTLTVDGTGFTSAASVEFGGIAMTTTYVSETQVTAAVDTTGLIAGDYIVEVADDAGKSNAVNFTLT